MDQQVHYGIALKAAGALFASIMGVLIKLLDATPLDLASIGMSLVAIAFGAALCCKANENHPLRGDWTRPHAWKVIVRGPLQATVKEIIFFTFNKKITDSTLHNRFY